MYLIIHGGILYACEQDIKHTPYSPVLIQHKGFINIYIYS